MVKPGGSLTTLYCAHCRTLMPLQDIHWSEKHQDYRCEACSILPKVT